VVWTCGTDGGRKSTNCGFTWTRALADPELHQGAKFPKKISMYLPKFHDDLFSKLPPFNIDFMLILYVCSIIS